MNNDGRTGNGFILNRFISDAPSAEGLMARSGYNAAVEALKLATEGTDLNYYTANTSQSGPDEKFNPHLPGAVEKIPDMFVPLSVKKVPYKFESGTNEATTIVQQKMLDLKCAETKLVLLCAENGMTFDFDTLTTANGPASTSEQGIKLIEQAKTTHDEAKQAREAFINAQNGDVHLLPEKPGSDFRPDGS